MEDTRGKKIFFNIKMEKTILCVLFLVASVFGEPRVDPLVLISSQGLVMGHRATDGDYSMFLGVPYARVDAADPFGVSTFFKC